MKVVYAPEYEINIGPHVWPTAKYRLIYERLARSEAFVFCEPETATWRQVGLVHCPAWVSRLRDCTMSPEEIAHLEIPWNAAIAA
ncbi:MAG: histone deacetylase, partial [Acidobacteriota bacterium]